MRIEGIWMSLLKKKKTQTEKLKKMEAIWGLHVSDSSYCRTLQRAREKNQAILDDLPMLIANIIHVLWTYFNLGLHQCWSSHQSQVMKVNSNMNSCINRTSPHCNYILCINSEDFKMFSACNWKQVMWWASCNFFSYVNTLPFSILQKNWYVF